MRITVFNAGSLGPKGKSLLERGVRAALGARARTPGELCLVFAADGQVRTLNKRFLGHDRHTDVIAFQYPRNRAAADAPFGDVYVSLGVARRQAKALGHPLLREALTLAVHGTLHLVGYDDGAAAAKKRMFARQDRLVAALLGDGKEKKARR